MNEGATTGEVEAALGRAIDALSELWGKLPDGMPPAAAFRIGTAFGSLTAALDEIREKQAKATAPSGSL